MQSLLKFITCGSVDDGKSTLIGHMLYDAKLVYADQEHALELDSKVGSTGGEIDYSLLLDGLMAEREQGITIDVAYRYFTTDSRSFIVADTPGHEEYTRNMAVGASFADLAVILVDASKGVLLQTKRHTRICAMMGIRSVVYAINKMDLVTYQEKTFVELQKKIHNLTSEYDFETIYAIPVSATCGDNITHRSQNMPWYEGKPLLSYLETVEIPGEKEKTGFVMPVQRVCRPDHTFRGFQGQIADGKIAVGQEVEILPSGERANVQELYCTDQKVQEAYKEEAVTICLDREVDSSRGCVIVRDIALQVGRMFVCKLLWMDDAPLVVGKNYILKLGTTMIAATVMKLTAGINVNDGNEVPVKRIYKNEMAICEISCQEPIVFEEFVKNREMGRFILIDRVSHMTAACGIVEKAIHRQEHLYWQDMDVTRELRASQKQQSPMTIWMTGLSGAGKSTIANALEQRLFSQGKHTMILDGDNIRMGLNKDLDFGEEDRIENIRRVAEVAKLMNDAGLIVLVSFISPFREDRRKAKEVIGDCFREIYISTPLEECEKRDVKGLYEKARKGKIANFSGISSPYESPECPDAEIDTTGKTVEEVVDQLIPQLQL